MIAETKIYKTREVITLKLHRANHKTYLQWIFTRQQVNDLERVLHDTNGHKFLAVVASVHHKRVSQALDDRALCLAETLNGETSCGVGQITSVLFLDGNVILKRQEIPKT